MLQKMIVIDRLMRKKQTINTKRKIDDNILKFLAWLNLKEENGGIQDFPQAELDKLIATYLIDNRQPDSRTRLPWALSLCLWCLTTCHVASS